MAHRDDGTLPTIPKTISIPTFKVTSAPDGNMDIPTALPFYYAGIQTMWLYWQVDLPLLNRYLNPLGMTPVSFSGAGLPAVFARVQNMAS